MREPDAELWKEAIEHVSRITHYASRIRAPIVRLLRGSAAILHKTVSIECFSILLL